MLNKKVQEYINKGFNIILTGKAGTGKSYTVKEIVKQYGDNKNISLCSTTGIASVNIGGQTLHSFLNIGLCKTNNIEKEYNRIIYNPYAQWQEVKKCDILIIDEISMCDGFLFELIDRVLRWIRQNMSPFGGVQVILVGDLYQLPPVQANDNDFFFNTGAYAYGNFKSVVLNKVYRQTDKHFVEVLNRIRLATHTQDDIDYLNKRDFSKKTNYALLDTTCLFPTNKEADILNRYRLNHLEGNIETFNAIDTYMTSSPFKKDYNKVLRAPETLELKEGARVILLYNINVDIGLCNGSIGHYVKNDNGLLIVNFNGENHYIKKVDFEVFEKGKTVFKRFQYPLTLGWGISIHKAQGMTLDNVAINFSKIFAPAQAYVALSRVKSYDGLYLKGLTKKSVFIDNRVVKFMNNMERKENG